LYEVAVSLKWKKNNMSFVGNTLNDAIFSKNEKNI
jgi:hypothetical protein